MIRRFPVVGFFSFPLIDCVGVGEAFLYFSRKPIIHHIISSRTLRPNFTRLHTTRQDLLCTTSLPRLKCMSYRLRALSFRTKWNLGYTYTDETIIMSCVVSFAD